MRNGFRIVDIDTHVNPSYDTLIKYLDPSGRARVEEFQPFVRTRSADGTTTRVLHVAPYPFDRFPGEAPTAAQIVAGGKGALEGRVTRSSSHIACRRFPAFKTKMSTAASRTWTWRAATSIS